MTNDKGILIKNIFYMLTYAFQVLKQSNYKEVEAEEFENIQDLFAAILAKGISQQIKQGLYREYIPCSDNLLVMRGKLNIRETMRNRMKQNLKLNCEFDELSENNIFNQILKTTSLILLREKSVKEKHRAALKKGLLFFSDVDTVEPSSILWNSFRFQKNNQNYKMLLNICYFVLDGLLQTTEKGQYKMKAFSEEHMERLYEKFVLEYCKKHHAYLSEIRAAQIKWSLDSCEEPTMIQYLPIMQTDIMLRYKEKVLIIDTKYYTHTMQTHFESQKIHSNHLYQIYTYVKNMDVTQSGNVSGLLLYAKTEEAIAPDCQYSMGGNRISVKTLDLNTHFEKIKRQLDEMISFHFGEIV